MNAKKNTSAEKKKKPSPSAESPQKVKTPTLPPPKKTSASAPHLKTTDTSAPPPQKTPTSAPPPQHNALKEDEFDFPEAIETSPRSPKLWLQIALFVAILGFAISPYIARRLPIFERWLAPGLSDERKGDQALQAERCSEARPAYEAAYQSARANKQTPRRRLSMLRYKAAFCAIQLQQETDATALAEQAMQHDPAWELPYPMLLHLYPRQGQRKPLDKLAQSIRQRFPKSWEMRLQLGNGYLHLRDFAQAIAAYEEGLALRPKTPALLDRLARALLLQPHTTPAILQRAEKLAKEATSLSPQPDLYQLETLALAYEYQKNFPQALAIALRAHRLAKQDDEIQRLQRLIDRLRTPPPASRPSQIAPPRTTSAPHGVPLDLPLTTSSPTQAHAPSHPLDLPLTTSSPAPWPHHALPTSRPASLPPPIPSSDPHQRSRKLLAPFD